MGGRKRQGKGRMKNEEIKAGGVVGSFKFSVFSFQIVAGKAEGKS